MNKRGQGISMEFIIIAAIALIVLIVIILFFTGGIQTLTGGQKEVIEGTVPDWQIKAWESRCKLACSASNFEDYCKTAFKSDTDGDGDSDVFYTCSSIGNADPQDTGDLKFEKGLGVECDDLKCGEGGL